MKQNLLCISIYYHQDLNNSKSNLFEIYYSFNLKKSIDFQIYESNEYPDKLHDVHFIQLEDKYTPQSYPEFINLFTNKNLYELNNPSVSHTPPKRISTYIDGFILYNQLNDFLKNPLINKLNLVKTQTELLALFEQSLLSKITKSQSNSLIYKDCL